MHSDPTPGSPHRRYNPLTGEWVLVSPQRLQRPWQGQIETGAVEERMPYDPNCFLCPGNQRAGDAANPNYSDTFVFENDFAALRESRKTEGGSQHDLLKAEIESGICRVICYSPRHDLTLAEMDVDAIRAVVDVWVRETKELGARRDINYVQIFENKGAAMGCSNPHPHGQIWAQLSIPNGPANELRQMARYREEHGTTLLGDYLTLELDKQERVVCENRHFAAIVPFWAGWPYETLLLSKRPVASIIDLDDNERASLADILKRMTTRYDNLFTTSFPYSAGLHQAPVDGKDYPECDLHLHFYPPLLRSASVKKFMVGYEMLAEPQRDLTPEAAANMLRSQSEMHYRDPG